MKTAGIRFTEATIRESYRTGVVRLQAFATIGPRRFEFAWLGEGHSVEVYDYPKSYEGGPRFCGYMPQEAGAKLVALVRLYLKQSAQAPKT